MARKFYYDTGTEKVGPVSGNDLVRLRAMGEINDETWVRRADNNTWRPLHTVNLREEEEEESNPGFFTILRRSGLLVPAIIMLAGILIFLVLAIGAVGLFLPIVLFVFIVWLFTKVLR